MSDLTTVKDILAGIDTQARQLRATIEEKRQAREILAAAPLPKSDVLAILQAGVDYWVSQAPDMLARSVAAIASRPGKGADYWGKSTPLLPESAPELAHLLPALLASAMKAGLANVISTMDEIEGCGDPWSERESTLASLDAAIEAAEADLEALRSQVVAAGLRWPGKELF